MDKLTKSKIIDIQIKKKGKWQSLKLGKDVIIKENILEFPILKKREVKVKYYRKNGWS